MKKENNNENVKMGNENGKWKWKMKNAILAQGFSGSLGGL